MLMKLQLNCKKRFVTPSLFHTVAQRLEHIYSQHAKILCQNVNGILLLYRCKTITNVHNCKIRREKQLQELYIGYDNENEVEKYLNGMEKRHACVFKPCQA